MSSKDEWSQWLLDSQIRGELGISEYFFQISLNVSIFVANFAWQFFHLVRLARIDRLAAVFNIVVRKRLIAIMPYPSRTHLKKSKWLHVFRNRSSVSPGDGVFGLQRVWTISLRQSKQIET